MNESGTGKITNINGPVIKAEGLTGAAMLDIAEVGNDGLIGEIIRLEGTTAVIQVYEDNTGLRPGEPVITSGMPLSVMLGPGLIAGIYDGIQRPLVEISRQCGSYILRGVKVSPLDMKREWKFKPTAQKGDKVSPGQFIGEVEETLSVTHKIMIPPEINGTIEWIADDGEYSLEDDIYTVSTINKKYTGRLHTYWPVRKPRPVNHRMKSDTPLITGLRVIDTLFPIARGGTAAIPGGFGTGKTMTQHSLAKWCNADIIVYIGCGERGNEMTDVLNDFPALIDPRTGRPLMERTIMIANTSNMPVPAREVSIYTGITIAEYFRDMGYNVAVMADSTSRWAEALRELSSRMGDMPAEEGFPPYLATRLSEFYERAGFVKNLSGTDGSITVIGAVSPPGGDFSEPVTQHTTRFIRCFWALDRDLADARHYPSISWTDSYSEYLEEIEEWWKSTDMDWSEKRKKLMGILLRDHELQQIVKLVGPDALPERDRFLLYTAEIIKNGFLQQNSFDKNDMFCSPEKQSKLLNIIIDFYELGIRLLTEGTSLSNILFQESVSHIQRLKSEISNEDIDKLEEFREHLLSEISLFNKKGDIKNDV